MKKKFVLKNLFGESELRICAQGDTTLSAGEIVSIKGLRYIVL